MSKYIRSVVVDPSSVHYIGNKLFDLSDARLNRDDTLLPFYRAQVAMKKKNVSINTVDFLLSNEIKANQNDYFSLGMLDNFSALESKGNILFKGFVLMEPPVVDPFLYQSLPSLTDRFEHVFVHNVIGDGYSLAGVDQSKLRQFYWPQPLLGVREEYWVKSNRKNKIVVINGHHKPRPCKNELYSKRIEAMVALAKCDAVDLYGRGWKRWWSRSALWAPYLLNYRKLLSIHKGECESKFDVLSQYRFCLCFENMAMTGFVTEKIFDCLYAGTVPLYWGAPDIEELIPPTAYIDVRKFSSWREMWRSVQSLSSSEVDAIRNAGRDFLNSEAFMKYYNSFENIVS